MPPSKGGNAKKEGGRAKKAENEERKAEAETKVKSAKEAETWREGAKGLSKNEVAAAKAAEAARKKQEREALLAAEEAALPSKPKAAPKAGGGGAKKKPDSGILAPSAGKGIASFTTNDPLGLRGSGLGDDPGEEAAPELSARGVEEMLEALEVVNQRTDKQAMGAKAGQIEQHPEKRFKAAFEAYLEREMPILRDEHPGLRQNQMRDKIFKKFEKSPENPFNQVQVEYNATKVEKVQKLQEVMAAREKKYAVSGSN